MKRVTTALREEAIRWCDRLSKDRGLSVWSIRFTHAAIAASPAMQIAWQEYVAIRARRDLDTHPRILWNEAAEQLRIESRDSPRPPKPLKPPKPKPPKLPKTSRQRPPKPRPPKPPAIPRKVKEHDPMAKKQTRRSISVSREMYTRAKAFAEAQGLSLSQLTEQALTRVIESKGP